MGVPDAFSLQLWAKTRFWLNRKIPFPGQALQLAKATRKYILGAEEAAESF